MSDTGATTTPMGDQSPGLPRRGAQPSRRPQRRRARRPARRPDGPRPPGGRRRRAAPWRSVLGTPVGVRRRARASAGWRRLRRRPARAARPRPRPGRRAGIEAVPAIRRRAVLDFLPELRPAWWVMRAWLLVYQVPWWQRRHGHRRVPVPRGARLGGAGRRGRRRRGGAVGAAGRRRPPIRGRLAGERPGHRRACCCSCGAVNDAQVFLVETRPADASRPTFAPGASAQHTDGGAISNIYAYDANGEPLDGGG